jgi:hypothetical protein
MKVIQIVLLALISLTLCQNSGIKVGITSNFFKILTKFDLNSLLQGMTLIDRAETSGKYLFNYDVICENLQLTNIVQPNNVVIDQETTSDGLPQVKVTLYNIKASIKIQYLYVKYGLIKETFDNPTGSVSISSIEGRYHFTKEGKLVVSEFNVEIQDFDVDVRKDFLNWLIGLFKGLIKSEITDKLNELGSNISDELNAWVEGDFSLDIGYGIQLNLTNTLRPQLTQILKFQKLNEIGLKVAKALFSKEILSDTLTSVLTFGILGSCFPTGHPEVVPDITPAVDMNFTTEYLTNEVQILISTFTMNNALYIAQSTEILEYQFDNTSTIVFPWNFDTEGLQEILPQYGEKYPGQNLEVFMKAYISPYHSTPYVEMSETGAKLVANFNLDFSTDLGEAVVEDLSLDVAVELPFTIQVKYDLLTINWGTISISNLVANKNDLNVPYDDLVTVVDKLLNTYVTKFIKGYTKNVALAAILTLVTGMEFKNFKLETKEGFLLTSIAVNLDK